MKTLKEEENGDGIYTTYYLSDANRLVNVRNRVTKGREIAPSLSNAR